MYLDASGFGLGHAIHLLVTPCEQVPCDSVSWGGLNTGKRPLFISQGFSANIEGSDGWDWETAIHEMSERDDGVHVTQRVDPTHMIYYTGYYDQGRGQSSPFFQMRLRSGFLVECCNLNCMKDVGTPAATWSKYSELTTSSIKLQQILMLNVRADTSTTWIYRSLIVVGYTGY